MFIEVDTAHGQDKGNTSCLATMTGSSLRNRVSSDYAGQLGCPGYPRISRGPMRRLNHDKPGSRSALGKERSI